MPRPSKISLTKINNVLNKSFFTSAGYTVETYDEVEKIVKISFVDNPKFSILLRFEKRTPNFMGLQEFQEKTEPLLLVTESPGDVVEVQTYQVGTFDSFLSSLSTWADRLKSEILIVDAFQKTIDGLKEELNKRIDEHIEDADAHFTENEKSALFEKLRKVEEQLEELARRDPKAKKDADEVKAVVEDFARAAGGVSKRAWYRSFYYRLLYLGQRVLTYGPVKALLTAEAKHLLGDSTPTDVS